MKHFKSTITKEEIAALPVFVFNGPITVIEDTRQMEEAVRFLLQQEYLGFDTETRPSFRKGESHPVSLLQLATPEEVFLFRLNKCGFGLSLQCLLSDPRVMKIGVGIRDDIRNLNKSAAFSPHSFVDLQEYVSRFGIEEKSFSKLMAIIFGYRISKRQRTTNWEALVLTEAQVRYAATDAWGALCMYQRLVLLETSALQVGKVK